MKPHSTRWMLLPLLLAAAVSIGVLVFSEISHARLFRAGEYMRKSLEFQEAIREVLSLATDAETAQRGFLLTGRNEYLEPYTLAIKGFDDQLHRLRTLAGGSSPEQSRRVTMINNLVEKRLNEIEISLALYTEGNTDAARALLATDIGKKTMDLLRTEVQAFNTAEQANAGALWTLWEQDLLYSRFGMTAISALNILLLIIIYTLAERESRRREQNQRELIRHKDQLEQTVYDRTAELSQAYRHLQSVQESEKSKLARDIHDELGSILVSAKMDASWVQQRLKDSPALAEKLERLLKTLDGGVQVKRRLIEELRPTLLDNLGLATAIEWQVSEICARSQLHCHVESPEDDLPVSSEVAIGLFRIVQEALTNIVRYAKARNVWVELTALPESLRLVVKDDGVGLPEDAAQTMLSHGILGMRERIIGLGGQFRIHGEPGKGTTIEVEAPYDADVSAAPSEKNAVEYDPPKTNAGRRSA